MIITRKDIEEFSSDWNTKTIMIKNKIEKEKPFQIQISQEDLRYLLWQFCNIREELDERIACSYGEDL
jgi:hypothetical protein